MKKKGTWEATVTSGSKLFVPAHTVTRVNKPARYCSVPIRGWRRGIVAVVNKSTRRAIGYSTESNLLIQVGIDPCGAALTGARHKRRSR